MTEARAGVVYLLAAGLLAYLWVTGNLARVTGYATRAAGGTPHLPAGAAALQPEHPITLPAFRGAAPGNGIRPVAARA